MLIPLLPSSSIDEIVAQVRAVDRSEVELLVPNNMKALQSSAGCTILKHIVADSGAQLTLFTNDDKTQRAAQNAGLSVIAVDGTIVGPNQPVGPSNPHQIQVFPELNGQTATSSAQSMAAGARDSDSAVALPQAASLARDTAIGAPVMASDDEFLAGLQAFEQMEAPATQANGQGWNSDDGALLSDGERGIGRQVAADDPWALAFDDIGVGMAQEPEPTRAPRQIAADAIPPRRTSRSQPDRSATAPKGRSDQRGNRSAFGDALTSVFPRQNRSRGAGGNSGGTPARTAAKGAVPAQPQRFSPWIMVALASVLLVVALLFSSGLFPFAGTAPQLQLIPSAPQSEQQTFNDLTIPIGDAAPTDGSVQVQAAVLMQPVRVEVRGQAAGTTVAPIGRASGAIVLRNTLSQPVLLRAGTIVPASNGVQFSVDYDVTVPASLATADGITFGRGEASLTANVPGAAGNIGPGSISSIPGYEGTLRIEQGAFGGGSDQEVRIVRPEDVNQVLPNALSRLYGTGTQSLQLAAAGRSGFTLMTDTISPTLESLTQLKGVEYGVFPPIGSVTSDGSFLLEMRATFNAVAEPTDRPIAAQLSVAARTLLVSDGRAAPDAQVQVTDWSFGQQGLIVAANVIPAGTTPTLSAELAAEVQQNIAGKSRQEALDYLNSLKEQGQITAFGSLPQSWEMVPENVQVVQAPQ